MRSLNLISSCVFSFFILNNAVAQSVKIAGEIINPTEKIVTISGNGLEESIEIPLTGNNFKHKLKLEEGYYLFGHGKEVTKVFLAPKFNLEIDLDTKAFDESLKYEGKGSLENNYLAKQFLKNEAITIKKYLKNVGQSTYVKKCADILETGQLELKKQKTHINRNFYNQENEDLQYQQMINLAQFESLKRKKSAYSNFKVSSKFPEPFKDFDPNNEALYNSNDLYKKVVNTYVSWISKKYNENESGTDGLLNKMKAIQKDLSNDHIKQSLVYNNALYAITVTEKPNEYFEIVKSIIGDSEKLTKIEKLLNKVNKLAKGNDSPTFTAENKRGGSVSLNNYHGKNVLIDVWSTWCAPCIAELPYLKLLEKEYSNKNIEFVKLCVWDDKDKWQSFLKENYKENRASNNELFLDEKSNFLKEYAIKGIPRFILIDTEGKIFNYAAKLPSNPKLKTQIDELLQSNLTN